MLRLFFNRNSLFVKTAFWGAALLTVIFFLRGGWEGLSASQRLLFLTALAQILFAKAVDLYPWYPKEARGPGIQLQFHKAIVPVSYLWLSLILLIWAYPHPLFLLAYNILFLPMGMVACILIYFHFRDPDRAQPNPLGSLHKGALTDGKITPDLGKTGVPSPPPLLQ